MGNIIELKNYQSLAVEKIDAELKGFVGDRYASAVKNHVAATIKHFCEENEQFARVVYETKRTLSDCCKEIMKGCGNSISDIDVYRGAVKNYFPNAEIDFHMTIKIKGDPPTAEEMARVPKDKPKKEYSGNSTQPTAVEDKPQEEPKQPAKKPPVKKAAPAEKKPVRQAVKKAKPPKEEPNVIQLSLF